MISGFPPFFNTPNAGDTPPMFAGLPLVNPLLNDASTNIETLNERITQLESVAQWLNMNLQMVNASVQQMQVQKQTLQALAEWQQLSKGTLEELAKNKPSAEPNPTTPTAFEQVAQSWWDGLQQQFVQLAQPLVSEKDAIPTQPKKRAERATKPKPL